MNSAPALLPSWFVLILLVSARRAKDNVVPSLGGERCMSPCGKSLNPQILQPRS